MAERYQPDITLDSKALVLALINHDNNLTLSEKEIIIRGIEANRSADIIPKNTQAIIAKARKPNGKTVTVYYDRLSASNVLDVFQPLLISLDGTEKDIREVVSVINGYCGTNLSVEDIQSTALTVEEMNSLMISENSPAWLGTSVVTLFTPTQSALSTEDDSVIAIGDDGVLTLEGE